jgi:hypothetical protein
MADDYVVRDNPAELRYEILHEGELVGGIWYRTAPGVSYLCIRRSNRRRRVVGTIRERSRDE